MIRQEKDIKHIQIGKEEGNDLLFANAMIWYKFNIKKLVLMLHSCSEKSKKKSNKNKCNYGSIHKTKYFGINLAKEVKDLHMENYKTLLRKNCLKSIRCSRMRKNFLTREK